MADRLAAFFDWAVDDHPHLSAFVGGICATIALSFVFWLALEAVN